VRSKVQIRESVSQTLLICRQVSAANERRQMPQANALIIRLISIQSIQ
jgi:hypothetical protein